MDTSLHLYISSKSSFLDSIKGGSQELNSFVIGLVFSCNQSDISNEFDLLETLFTIISLKREDIQTAGILKFLQESQNYLKIYNTTISYISELFCKFCKYISELKFTISQIEVFSQEFSKTAQEFVSLFCENDIFAIMLKAIMKNRPLLKCFLASVSDNLVRKIDELSKIHYLADLNEFCEVLEATCSVLEQGFTQDMRNLANFLLFKVQSYAKHHKNEDLTRISEILVRNSKVFPETEVNQVNSELSRYSFGSLLIDSQLKNKNPLESSRSEDPNTVYIKPGQPSQVKMPDLNVEKVKKDESNFEKEKKDDLNVEKVKKDDLNVEKAKKDDSNVEKVEKDDSKQTPKASLIKVVQKPYTDEPITQDEKSTESFFDTFRYGKLGLENSFKQHKQSAENRNYEESKESRKSGFKGLKPHEKERFFDTVEYKGKKYVKKSGETNPYSKLPNTHEKTHETKEKSPEKEENNSKPLEKQEINLNSSINDENNTKPSEKEESKSKPELPSTSTALQIKIKPKSYEDEDLISDHQAPQSSNIPEPESTSKPEQEIKNLIIKLLLESLNSPEEDPNNLLNSLKGLSRYPGFKKTLYLEILNLLKENSNFQEKINFWKNVVNISENFIEKHQVEAIRQRLSENQRQEYSAYNRRGRGVKK
jgi:hypothetical protein